MEWKAIAVIFALILTNLRGFAEEPEWRIWTSTAGTTVEASATSLEDETLTLVKKSDGKKLTLRTSQLSEPDREFLKELQKKLDEGSRGETSIDGINATPGEISPPIACTGSEWHYRLYLPKNFHTGRAWPVWFIMSPGGGGDGNAARRYIPGAERLGCILALSVESKNKFEHAYTAVNAMVDDVLARVPVSKELTFATGFSGGARGAYVLAEYRPFITGVLACGSGHGIYVDNGFRSAKLPKSTYVYSLMGTNCFNRDEAVRSHDKFPENFRLRFFVGNHFWADPPFTDEAMARVYGEALLQKKDKKFDSYRRIYSRTMAMWAEEMASEQPGEAYQWAEFIEEFPGDRDASNTASALVQKLDLRPESDLAIRAEKSVRDFAFKHFNKNISGAAAKELDPARTSEAKSLAEKYKDLPQAEILIRLSGRG